MDSTPYFMRGLHQATGCFGAQDDTVNQPQRTTTSRR
jgi:hypothetical protein